MDGLIKQSLNKIKSFAGNVIKQAPQALQNYANTYAKVAPYVPFVPKVTTPQVQQQNWQSLNKNVIQPAAKWFTSPGSNPLYDAYAGTFTGGDKGNVQVPKFNFVEPATAKIKNPTLRTGAQFIGGLGEGLLNIPSTFVESAGKLNKGLVEGARDVYQMTQGKKVAPQSLIRDIANAAELPVNIATMGEGGANVLQSNSLKRKLITGAQGGWKFGGLFGGLSELQNIKDTDTVADVLAKTGRGYIEGGASGMAAGSLLGLFSFGYDRVRGKPIIPDVFNGKTMQEAASMLKLAHEGVNRGDAALVYEVKRAIDNPRGYFNQDGTANTHLMDQHKAFIDDFYKQMTGDTKSKLSWQTKAKQMFDLVNLASKNGDIWGTALSEKTITPQNEAPSQKVKVTKDGKIKIKINPTTLTQPEIQPNGFMKEQQEAQKIVAERQAQIKKALEKENPSFGEKMRSFWADVKLKLISSRAPITDVLNAAEKKSKLQVRPTQDIRLQLPRVQAADVIGDEFANRNGLVDVIRQVDDPGTFSEYLKAKHHLTGDTSAETGLNLEQSRKIVNAFEGKYGQLAQKIRSYTQKLLDYRVESGLMSPEHAELLKKKYPDYVPLTRIFTEEELGAFRPKGKGVASISSTGLNKRVGSERVIQDPLFSLLEMTRDTFRRGETNKAAEMLVAYKNLPGNPYQLRPLGTEKTQGKHTISVFRNGVKEIYETTPEVSAAAKNLTKEQMGVIGKILSYPVRLLKVGATGILNPVFTIANYVKDQGTAFINSDHALSTSAANPVTFMKSATALVGHGKEYQLMLEQGLHGGTTFDIYRDNPVLTIEKIRSTRSAGSRIKYTARHPGELLRLAEDIVGSTEKMTRMQQFIGTRDALINEGRTATDANLLAGKAYRENTVDFADSGTWGRVINQFIPYFNAGIQGSRKFVNTMNDRPAQTAAKLTIAFFTPMALATAWNLADPKRKMAYDDIQDWEKKNNFIIVPPNPVKDERGAWNVIKIPISQEAAALTGLVRRQTEAMYGGDPVKAKEFAAALSGTVTPYDLTDPRSVSSSMMPQIAKSEVEIATNKNLFTGKDVVPTYLKNEIPEKQVYKWTSGTARKIGKVTNLSPIAVENAVSTNMGTGGKILLNASDRLLNKAGAIPENQIGGTDIGEGFTRRFSQAAGGQLSDKAKESAAKGMSPRASAAYDYLHSPKTLDENGLPSSNRQESMAFAQIRLANPQILAREAQEARVKAQVDGTPINPLYNLPVDRQRTVLLLASLPPGEDKSALQKENIAWLKPYWEDVSAYFSRIGSQPSQGLQAPKASAYVQAQMDAGNWKDPQVKAYLDANTAYKNEVRAQLGLTPLATNKYPVYQKKPKKVTIGSVKKGKSVKLKALKLPKTKKLSKMKFNFKVLASKQPKIKVKMPKA